MARGIGLGQALNAFTTGAGQGIDFVNAIDARKQRMEDRQLAMADRTRGLQQQDEDRARQKVLQSRQDKAYQDDQTKNYLAEQYARAKANLDVDVDGLGRLGIQVSKHFSPKFKQWTDAATEVNAGKLEYNDPKFIKQLSWRLSDQIGKGIGTAVETNMTSANGVAVPVGTKIDSKEIHKLKAAPGGQMIAMLEMTGTTPDGKKIKWLNPATEGRGTGSDANLLPIDVKKIIQMAQGDVLLSDAMDTPEWQKEIEAKLIGLGKTIPADEMEKERLKSLTDVEVAKIRAGATEKSARIRANAVGGRSGSASKGGTDQQLIEYFKANLFADVKDPKKATELSAKYARDFLQSRQKQTPTSETIRKIANDLIGLKDERGRKPLYKNYDEALKKAEEVYGSLTARFDREPDAEAAKPSEYIRKPDDSDIYDLLGEE